MARLDSPGPSMPILTGGVGGLGGCNSALRGGVHDDPRDEAPEVEDMGEDEPSRMGGESAGAYCAGGPAAGSGPMRGFVDSAEALEPANEGGLHQISATLMSLVRLTKLTWLTSLVDYFAYLLPPCWLPRLRQLPPQRR